jgi:hypothetical protein
MARERFHPSPGIARIILILGAAIHFSLCIPLYGRRGFPEVDPFWSAMIWLWLPPVVISAAYCRWTRKRASDLAIYSLITGFVVSWGIVLIVPSRTNPGEAFLGLAFWWPALMAGVMIAEMLSRAVLARMRDFIPESGALFCGQCGYCLHGLVEHRCPECGTPFVPDSPDSSFQARVLPMSRGWTSLFVMLVLAATLAFPPLYRLCTVHSLILRGASAAESDWAKGNATWFVTYAELQVFTPAQYDRYSALRFRKDPGTGLEVRDMWRDWEHRTWQASYREVIERKLRESGGKRPAF